MENIVDLPAVIVMNIPRGINTKSSPLTHRAVCGKQTEMTCVGLYQNSFDK